MLPLALPIPGQGSCLTDRQHPRQASVLARAVLGIYSFPHRVVVEIGCAFTACNYMVPFIPKDFQQVSLQIAKGSFTHHWKAASFKWSSAALPSPWRPRVGKKGLLCWIGLEWGQVGRVHKLIWFESHLDIRALMKEDQRVLLVLHLP